MNAPEGLPTLLAATPVDPETVKACCATAYGHDVVGLLLGDSYHPGGAALTCRLAETMALRPGERLLDVVSGNGTSALLLAVGRGVQVTGVDLGPTQVADARARVHQRGLDGQVRFEPVDQDPKVSLKRCGYLVAHRT